MTATLAAVILAVALPALALVLDALVVARLHLAKTGAQAFLATFWRGGDIAAIDAAASHPVAQSFAAAQAELTKSSGAAHATAPQRAGRMARVAADRSLRELRRGAGAAGACLSAAPALGLAAAAWACLAALAGPGAETGAAVAAGLVPATAAASAWSVARFAHGVVAAGLDDFAGTARDFVRELATIIERQTTMAGA